MSDDWQSMTEDERKDLVGCATRVVGTSPAVILLSVRDCCVAEHVRVTNDGGDGVHFERRVQEKNKRELPAPD